MSLKIFLAILVALVAPPHPLVTGEISRLESVPDLEKAMYPNVVGFPCVRLLNLSGEIGCSNPGRQNVIAPIVRLKNSDDQLTQLSAVLVSSDEMQKLFLRISNDPHFAQNIAGVLVDPTGIQNLSSGFSPDKTFPQAEFAPYQTLNYEWNSAGSGIMWKRYNFPVFLLSGEGTSIVQELANKNAKKNYEYPINVAEFDLVMQTTAVGSRDSESCLKEWSCQPLGGYSVWSSLPQINVSMVKHSKPIILALAAQDSASFFRDQSLGADSPLSGLIALLAAVDALSHVPDLEELEKQLVFAVFTGEAWGYLGSRRFLLELDIGSDAVSGLNSTMIQQVLEIGSVGKGSGQGETTFFTHAEGDSSSTKEILTAFHSSSDSLGSDNVNIKTASASNPGLPPSSLMSFLRKVGWRYKLATTNYWKIAQLTLTNSFGTFLVVGPHNLQLGMFSVHTVYFIVGSVGMQNPSTSGVVLEEFDASFTNKFYRSHLDNSSNINSSSVAAAAALVARTLYILARGDLPLNLMILNSIKVNVSLVEELVGCLLTCQPGLSCGIVKNFISPISVCPSHYVGVFLDSPPDTQYPQYADDTSRFVWNFLADRTSTPMYNTSSCTSGCKSSDEVCIGAETGYGGRCVKSTTRYVPAYSTRLKVVDNSWHVIPATASDPMGFVDPVWTESNWNAINLRVYTVQSSLYDRSVLLGGVGITVAAYVAVITARAYLSKALKHD